jgi:hypothetical protein
MLPRNVARNQTQREAHVGSVGPQLGAPDGAGTGDRRLSAFLLGNAAMKANQAVAMGLLALGAATLFTNAEAALKHAQGAREPYPLYSPSINSRVAKRVSMEMRLRNAIGRREFVILLAHTLHLTEVDALLQ